MEILIPEVERKKEGAVGKKDIERNVSVI